MWVAAGRVVAVVAGVARNEFVRAQPGTGFTDPSRVQRAVAAEHMLAVTLATALLPPSAILAAGCAAAALWAATAVTVLSVLVMSFVVDKAFTNSAPVRAEAISMSLLSATPTD